MKELMMKARSGVTLVELLVVILIVTILSVSMLPLLQPFVTESQYAAEAIPAIGNLRTQIGLYMYDHSTYPCTNDTLLAETWTTNKTDSAVFAPAIFTLSTGSGVVECPEADHIQGQLKVNYEDLKGRRSRPTHYQYFPISPKDNNSYVIGCFGDGNGLKAGTGYAVCELNFPAARKKYIGTWKQYKTSGSTQLRFVSDDALVKAQGDTSGLYINCYVPSLSQFNTGVTGASSTGKPALVTTMEGLGWEFD